MDEMLRHSSLIKEIDDWKNESIEREAKEIEKKILEQDLLQEKRQEEMKLYAENLEIKYREKYEQRFAERQARLLKKEKQKAAR